MKKYVNPRKVLLGVLLTAALPTTGCGSAEDFVFTNSAFTPNTAAPPSPPIPAPPVARDDSFNALGNATLNQAPGNGVLTNDTANGAVISAFDAIGSEGGVIELDADGGFTYSPVLGFVGTETFTYTLTNADGDSTATVTLTSAGFGRFVDNSQSTNGNGSQSSPFNNLPDALAAAGSGDTIFVYFGDGTNTNQAGPFTLPPGVNLIGQAEGLVLSQTIEPAGNRPVLQGPITLGGDNIVAGLQLENSGDVFFTANDVSNLTIDNNVLIAPTLRHMELANIGGLLTVTDNMFEPHNALIDEEYFFLENIDTDVTVTITGNTFTDDATSRPDDAVELDLEGTTIASVTFSRNTLVGEDTVSAFDSGIEVDIDDTSQVTLTADGNTFTNVGDEAFDLDHDDDATFSATITGNTINRTDGDGITVCAQSTNTTSLIISGNVISNAGGNSVDIDNDSEPEGSFRVLIENNNCSLAAGDDLAIAADRDVVGTAESAVFIRSNTLASTSQESIDLYADDIDLCADITGNIVSANMLFEDDGSGSLRVEQFSTATGGPLNSLNTFIGSTVVEANGAGNDVVPVAEGACGTP